MHTHTHSGARTPRARGMRMLLLASASGWEARLADMIAMSQLDDQKVRPPPPLVGCVLQHQPSKTHPLGYIGSAAWRMPSIAVLRGRLDCVGLSQVDAALGPGNPKEARPAAANAAAPRAALRG
jgi:hypothetical protein